MLVLEVIIISKSPSVPIEDEMSSIKFDSSFNDSEAILSILISPQSMLPELWVAPSGPRLLSLTKASS